MPQITFQVIEGLEAGRVYRDVPVPLTIGREEDNDIQLNDERVSRFHAKIQNDSGRMILTDLDSTNGTRVNGHPVRLRVLRPGDLIMMGRCVLLVGGQEELRNLHQRLDEAMGQATIEFGADVDPADLVEAFPHGRPPLPGNLTPLQTAELADLIEYFRTELLAVLRSPVEEIHSEEGDFLRIARSAWLRLEALGPEMAELLNKLTSPEEQ